MNILGLFAIIPLLVLPNQLTVGGESIRKGPQSEQYLLEVVQHLLGQHSKEELFKKTRHDIQALLKDLNELDDVEKKEEYRRQTKNAEESYKEESTMKDTTLSQKIKNVIHELDKKESKDVATSNKHLSGHLLLGKFTRNGDNYRSKSNAMLSDERYDASSAARESAKLLAKYFRQGDVPSIPKKRK